MSAPKPVLLLLLIGTLAGLSPIALTAQPSAKVVPTADKAFAALIAEQVAQLGIKPKTVTLPWDRALDAMVAIKRGDFDAAEHIAGMVQEQSTLQSWRFYPFNEFMGGFARGGFDPALLAGLDKWVAKAPDSANAHLLRAQYFENAAWAARGDAASWRVPIGKLNEFDHDMALAAADARTAITLNPNNPWSYSLLLHTVSGNANSDEMEAAFQVGIRAFPAYYELYRMRLYSLTPKWGGSITELYKFIDTYAAPAPDDSPLKFLYLHLYAYLLDAGYPECQLSNGSGLADCFDTLTRRFNNSSLDDGIHKALNLYKVSDPNQFSMALWPVLGLMASSSARGSSKFGALLQSAADIMGSDNRIVDLPGHNSFVLDDITAHVWADQNNPANADRKYREALRDVDHTTFASEAQKDEALVGVLDDMTSYANNTSQFQDIIVDQAAANFAGGPNHSNVPFMACYAYYRLKRFNDAAIECTRVIDGGGRYLPSYYWRAKAYEGLGQWDASIADFTPVAEGSNNWFRVGAALDMSFDFGQKNDFAGELAVFDRYSYLFDESLQPADDLAVSYNNRCYAYMKLGQMQKAMDDCTTSLRFGHVPDAAQKQQELIKLGFKPSVSQQGFGSILWTIRPGTIAAFLTAILVPVVFSLLRRTKAFKFTGAGNDTEATPEQWYKKWDRIARALTLAFGAAATIILWLSFSWLERERAALLRPADFVLTPPPAYFGLLALFAGILLCPVPLRIALQNLIGKDGVEQLYSYSDKRSGIDSRRFMRFVTRVAAPIIAICAFLGFQSYAVVNAQGVTSHPYFALKEHSYRWPELRHLKLIQSYEAPNGSIRRDRPYYVLTMSDGSELNFHGSFLAISFSEQRRLAALIAARAHLDIDVVNPYP